MEPNTQLLHRAQQLMGAERPHEAERLFRQLLLHTHVIDFEYDDWLKGIAECYRTMGRLREAGYVYLYLHFFERAAEVFTPSLFPVEAARVRDLEARRASNEGARRLYREAAHGYAEAGLNVLSAIASAQAKDPPAERKAWEHVLTDPRLHGRAYEQALVHFNL